MKKTFALCFAIVLACLPFVACKKSSKPANEKEFSLYFPTIVTNTGEKSTKDTNAVIGTMDAFYSLCFVSNQSWANGLENNNFEFEIISNRNTEIEFVVELTTDEKTTIYNYVCETINGKGSLLLQRANSLSGETKITISLAIPGGKGIDGMLFDKTNAITGFVWGVEKINFKAEHK